jgi:hypothetical protein
MEVIFGAILVAIVGIVTWCVASEGAWGSGLTFLAVLFAGLLAMNFFEPVAGFLDDIGSGMERYSDFVALVGLFALFTFLLRLATDTIAPTEIDVDARVYQASRWLFGLAAGYTTMAVLLTALHTAPLPRSFLGFSPEKAALMEFAAPDRQWLGFTQHVSEKVLARRVFDGAQFNPQPYGTDQTYWPSFPIRYATRRQEGGGAKKVGVGSGGATGPAAPPPPAGGF